jgi:PAS domain S-box-containing protein
MGLPADIQAWADGLPIAVIATATDGTVVYWNQAATALYQWTAREALGRDILTLTPSMQSKGEAEAVMARLKAGETWHGRIVLRRRDGMPFDAYVADVPLHGGTELILGISAQARRKASVIEAAAALSKL